MADILINRGVNLDPLSKWSKVRSAFGKVLLFLLNFVLYSTIQDILILPLQVGLVVYDSQVPIGATPEYMAGFYMVGGLFSSVCLPYCILHILCGVLRAHILVVHSSKVQAPFYLSWLLLLKRKNGS